MNFIIFGIDFGPRQARGSVSLNWLSTTIDDAKSEGDGLADADGA
jgi:hypothetical protein